MLALAIVAEGDGACKIAYCRVCLEVIPIRINKRGPKRPYCQRCKPDWHLRTCKNCGKVISPGKRNRFCSTCLSSRTKVYQQAYQALHAAQYRKPKPAVHAHCKECGIQFAKRAKTSLFCSKMCQARNSHRIHSPLRRARKKSAQTEVVNPFTVFDRDGWRCQICFCSTPKRLRGSSHDRAPELDHIIPLSKGGEHSYRNTQCACHKCNLEKRNKILGQLRLFG